MCHACTQFTLLATESVYKLVCISLDSYICCNTTAISEGNPLGTSLPHMTLILCVYMCN